MRGAASLRMPPSWHPMQFGASGVFAANPALAVVSGGDIASLPDAWARSGRETLTRSGGAGTGHPKGTVNGRATITETSGRTLRTTTGGAGTGDPPYTSAVLVNYAAITDYASTWTLGQVNGVCSTLGCYSNSGTNPQMWFGSGGTGVDLLTGVDDSHWTTLGTLPTGAWVLLMKTKVPHGESGAGWVGYVNGFLANHTTASNNIIPHEPSTTPNLPAGFGFFAHSASFPVMSCNVAWAELWNRVLTVRERMIWERWLRTYLLTQSGGALDMTQDSPIVVIGDSNTVGYGASDAAHAWPALVQTYLTGQGLAARVINKGAIGAKVSDKLPLALYDVQASGLVRGGGNLVVIALGTNDCINGRSAADIETDLTALHQAARDLGAESTIACTIPPDNYATKDAGSDAVKAAVNTWIRANYRGALGAKLLLEFNDPGGGFAVPAIEDPNGSGYISDHLHFSDTGLAAVAAYAGPLLAGLVPR